METLGAKIRRQRRRLGLTLDELAGRTAISKPYLSLIETGRVPNPPSDDKLKKLEQTLGFGQHELLTQAHLQRTPRDVRAMLTELLANGQGAVAVEIKSSQEEQSTQDGVDGDSIQKGDGESAQISTVLQELLDRTGRSAEKISSNAVPVINQVAGGYPSDFTDLSFPTRVAQQYVGCPDLADKDAFAARVHGDSMTPKYRQGDIVVFSPALPPRNGDDCFVRFDNGQTTFKRVFFETDASVRRPVIRLQPRNEQYPPTIIASDKVSGLYRAVYRFQRVDEE